VRAGIRRPPFFPRRRPKAPRGNRVRIFRGLPERISAIVSIKAAIVERFTDGAVIRDEIAAPVPPQVKLSPMTS
jgi:hypothetical protein